jgi:hypothetical protein
VRPGTACLLVAVAGCVACGGTHALTAAEYRERATRICTGGRGTRDARPRWREFSRLRAPAALAGEHRAVVHLQRRRLTAEHNAVDAMFDVLGNGHLRATFNPRYLRFVRQSGSLQRAQRSALHRLGLPRSCADLADDALAGPPPSPADVRRARELFRRFVAGL